MVSASLEQQVEAFACGTETQYAFPAELSVEERKVVKNAAKKFGLSSDSFGMGAERCIHIFKKGGSTTPALQPIVYSVKNTFVDEPVDPSQPVDRVLGPASQSMPAGAFQDHLSAEVVESCVADVLKESFEESPKEEVLPVVASASLPTTVEDSADASWEGDTSSTVESDSHDTTRETYCVKNTIKNTFLHFEETDAKENADPRIIQSMPNGKFAEAIQAEQTKAAMAAAAEASGRPQALSENLEESQGMTFPSTPNAETSYNKAFHNNTPTVQWTQAPQEASVSVLAPAVWNPAAHFCPMAPIVESSPTAAAVPMPPPGPPPCLALGTPVVVCGLVNQPAFNGLHGAVSAFDETCGRYNIMLDMGAGSQRMVKLKAENLVLSQPPLMPMQPQVQPQPTGYDMNAGWTNVGYEVPTSNVKPALKLELMV